MVNLYVCLLLFIIIISSMEKMASLTKKKNIQLLSEDATNVDKQRLGLQDETTARGNFIGLQ